MSAEFERSYKGLDHLTDRNQCQLYYSLLDYRLLDGLVVECWHRVREVPGSIPIKGAHHTKDVIKMVPGSSLV